MGRGRFPVKLPASHQGLCRGRREWGRDLRGVVHAMSHVKSCPRSGSLIFVSSHRPRTFLAAVPDFDLKFIGHNAIDFRPDGARKKSPLPFHPSTEPRYPDIQVRGRNPDVQEIDVMLNFHGLTAKLPAKPFPPDRKQFEQAVSRGYDSRRRPYAASTVINTDRTPILQTNV